MSKINKPNQKKASEKSASDLFLEHVNCKLDNCKTCIAIEAIKNRKRN